MNTDPMTYVGCDNKPRYKPVTFKQELKELFQRCPRAFLRDKADKFNVYRRYMQEVYPEIFIKGRKRVNVSKRHAFYYVCASLDNPQLQILYADIRLTHIGQVFGQDHSMVIYARDLVQDMIETNQADIYKPVIRGLIKALINDTRGIESD